MKSLHALFIRTLPLIFMVSCQPKVVEQPQWKTFFDRYGVTGGVVVYQEHQNKYLVYNEERMQQAFLPASTFKIANSLIALETGTIEGAETIIKWDSVDRGSDAWNQDLNMRDAFRYSAVWYYQEVARRIGSQQMQDYVERLEYGNRDISGAPVDSFWLKGNLRTSGFEQIDFLRKLYHQQLPLSQRVQQEVMDIMTYEQRDDFILYAKTGWAMQPDPDIGWFVGFVETPNEVTYFALNINIHQNDQAKARYDIAKNIFLDLGLIRSPQVR